MNPLLYADAAVEVGKFVESTYKLYEKGVLTNEQMSKIWHEAGIDVANAEKLWQNAGSATGATASSG